MSDAITAIIHDACEKLQNMHLAGRTPVLETLWEQVSSWSHPEHPFRDPGYSPDSLMPACDFTLWIRDRLLEDDTESIRGLLAYLSIESGAWWSVVDSFLTWRVPGFEGVLEAELRAAMLLCYRMGFAKEMRHLRFDWPRMWSVILAEGAERYAALPPTTRLVLTEFNGRPKGQKFNLSLFYGDRCYGNNAEWNRHYLATLGADGLVGDWVTACEDILPSCRTLVIQAAREFYRHDLGTEPCESNSQPANLNQRDTDEAVIVAIVEQHWKASYDRQRVERERDREERAAARDAKIARMTPAERVARLARFQALAAQFDE